MGYSRCRGARPRVPASPSAVAPSQRRRRVADVVVVDRHWGAAVSSCAAVWVGTVVVDVVSAHCWGSVGCSGEGGWVVEVVESKPKQSTNAINGASTRSRDLYRIWSATIYLRDLCARTIGCSRRLQYISRIHSRTDSPSFCGLFTAEWCSNYNKIDRKSIFVV